MLRSPTTFPNPGSYARFKGERVRIIQHNGDSRILISRSRQNCNEDSITATVTLADLKPARAPANA